MRWPRSALGLCSPSAQRTDSLMFDFPQPFGPTMAVTPGITRTTVFSANDLKPWSVIDSRRILFLTTEKCSGPKEKTPRVGPLGAEVP